MMLCVLVSVLLSDICFLNVDDVGGGRFFLIVCVNCMLVLLVSCVCSVVMCGNVLGLNIV